MQLLKISLSTSKVDRFEVPAACLGLDQEIFQNIKVQLDCKKLDNGGMHVVLEVSSDVEMDCDRTLKRFTAPVAGSHEMVLYTEDQEADVDSCEYIELDPGQRFFDLSETVHDTLLLAIPARKVAPEAENQPIQTVFGVPAPEVDQRWAALLTSQDT